MTREKCPFCGSDNIYVYRRGYSRLLGIIGFFLVPVIGLLIGYVGQDDLMQKCNDCGNKWRN